MVSSLEPVLHTAPALRVALLSTYELGRQPFGVASPAAWLRSAGFHVEMGDLAIDSLDEQAIAESDIVAFHVPMHTATRLAAGLIDQVRAINRTAHLCFFGLYAPLNEGHLTAMGADSIIGPDAEQRLLELCERLAGERGAPHVPSPSLTVDQRVPDRVGLPPLERYARLRTPGGPDRLVGYTEATRGCKHMCRHCPVVPVYQGRFTAIAAPLVLEDIRRQVSAGAEHITFGDPDFFNGPAHSLRIVEQLHREFPDLTYDATIKVQHLVDNADILSRLRATGCVLITTAVESFDDAILDKFDKRHTMQDLVTVVERLRSERLALNPTFVAFTPWTTLEGYLRFLEMIRDLGLDRSVAPVQYVIRLLVTARSRLLELDDVRELVGEFDPTSLVHPWRHPDSSVDDLHAELTQLVTDLADAQDDRRATFRAVWDHTRAFAGRAGLRDLGDLVTRDVPDDVTVPYLTEPWYC